MYVHQAIPILSLCFLHHPYIPSFLIRRIFFIFLYILNAKSCIATAQEKKLEQILRNVLDKDEETFELGLLSKAYTITR